MQLTIRGHHLSITPAIEEKITAHFQKMTKHLDDVCSIQVKLQKNHRLTAKSHKGQDNHNVEVILRVPGKELFAQASSDNMYDAIGILSERIRKQLAKYKSSKLIA